MMITKKQVAAVQAIAKGSIMPVQLNSALQVTNGHILGRVADVDAHHDAIDVDPAQLVPGEVEHDDEAGLTITAGASVTKVCASETEAPDFGVVWESTRAEPVVAEVMLDPTLLLKLYKLASAFEDGGAGLKLTIRRPTEKTNKGETAIRTAVEVEYGARFCGLIMPMRLQ